MLTVGVGTTGAFQVTLWSVDVEAALVTFEPLCAAPAGIEATTLPVVVIPETLTV
jgi:hypothetical protein